LEQEANWEEAVIGYNRALAEMKPTQTDVRAETYSHIGRCLMELGRGTEALLSLEKALTLNPNSPDAHLRMAQLMIAADIPAQAEPHLAYLNTLRPNDAEVIQTRGEMYAAQNLPELAERDLLRAYDLSKDRDGVAQRLSQFYAREKKPEKAREILVRASERSGHKSRILLALARLEETEGNAAQAEAAYRNAALVDDSIENNHRLAQFLARNGEVAEAEKVLHKVDAMQPTAPTAASDLQLVSGHLQQALSGYEAAYSRQMSGLSVVHKETSRADSLSATAVKMIETRLAIASQGDRSALTEARKRLTEIGGSLDPATRHILGAETSLLAGDLSVAEQLASEALDDQESRAPALYLLGVAAATRGDTSQALNLWQNALDTDPDYIPARLSLAAAAIGRGDGTKAEEFVIDVVRDEPANVNALLLYARALLLQKHYESARSLAERALAAERSNAQAAILLGDIALQRHQLALALLQYEKAMLLEPASRDAVEGLTAVYEKGDVNTPMLRKLERIAQSGTPSSRLMEITGRLYASQHMNREATRCLRRAVEMDPSRQSAALALAGAYINVDRQLDAKSLLSKHELRNLAIGSDAASTSLLAALAAEHRGDRAEAVRDYEAVVRAGDPSGIASNNLAWIYATQGKNLGRALQLAQHALELKPGDPEILDTLGVVQVQNRQFTQAIASFQSGASHASEMNGMNGLQRTIEAHLAQARELAGQPANR
jgi:tetratricopeptide (TPR) repeat protein